MQLPETLIALRQEVKGHITSLSVPEKPLL